jgi:hypothetical protein
MTRTIVTGLSLLILLLGAFVGYVVWRNQPLPPDEFDIAILERTQELLAEEMRWGRDDDRKCDPSDVQLSLYCALERASVEITGEFHHRSAALQEVRYAIEVVRPNANYAHRLMDFNNDEAVDFQELHRVLALAVRALKRGGGSSNAAPRNH